MISPFISGPRLTLPRSYTRGNKMTCNFSVTSKQLGTHILILSNGINMTRPVMILFFVIYKKYIPSDPMHKAMGFRSDPNISCMYI